MRELLEDLRHLIADTRRVVSEESDPKEQLFVSSAYESLRTSCVTVRLEKKSHASPRIFPSKELKRDEPKVKETQTEPLFLEKPAVVIAPKQPTPLPVEMRELFEKTLPHLKLNFSLPSDVLAKERATAWKKPPITSPVVVLCYGEKGLDRAFLQNLTRAIDTLLTPATLVEAVELEREKRVDALLSSPSVQWIFTTNSALSQSRNLSTHYREIPNTKQRFLAQIPLCIIPPPSFYLKNSAAKRALWEMLCKKIKG